jgi:hypothetical protein
MAVTDRDLLRIQCWRCLLRMDARATPAFVLIKLACNVVAAWIHDLPQQLEAFCSQVDQVSR